MQCSASCIDACLQLQTQKAGAKKLKSLKRSRKKRSFCAQNADFWNHVQTWVCLLRIQIFGIVQPNIVWLILLCRMLFWKAFFRLQAGFSATSSDHLSVISFHHPVFC
jgi:hypothetical protein